MGARGICSKETASSSAFESRRPEYLKCKAFLYAVNGYFSYKCFKKEM